MACFITGNTASAHSPNYTKRLPALSKTQSRIGLCNMFGTYGPAKLTVDVCDGKRCLRFVVSSTDKLQSELLDRKTMPSAVNS